MRAQIGHDGLTIIVNDDGTATMLLDGDRMNVQRQERVTTVSLTREHVTTLEAIVDVTEGACDNGPVHEWEWQLANLDGLQHCRWCPAVRDGDVGPAPTR